MILIVHKPLLHLSSPLLESKNMTALKHNLKHLDIRYVILPNHRNDLGNFVDNMNDRFKIPSLLQND